MEIQDLLGLPLIEGIAYINSKGISTRVIETFSPCKKGVFKDNNNFNEPYIIRIREIDNGSIELLISYF